MLRHKSIDNTMKCIHSITFQEEDYDETVATTPEEIKQLSKLAGQNTMKTSLMTNKRISTENPNDLTVLKHLSNKYETIGLNP